MKMRKKEKEMFVALLIMYATKHPLRHVILTSRWFCLDKHKRKQVYLERHQYRVPILTADPLVCGE